MAKEEFVFKTCWWSVRLRREARGRQDLLMPLICEAEAESVRITRSKRLETLNELEMEDEEEHFLNTFSFLANVSTYGAHLYAPAPGKDFFIWVYLFVRSCHTG